MGDHDRGGDRAGGVGGARRHPPPRGGGGPHRTARDGGRARVRSVLGRRRHRAHARERPVVGGLRRSRAHRELSSLLDRAPRNAYRYRDGDLQTVPIGEVLPGDLLLVKPGDVVPVDGVLRPATACSTSRR